MRRTVVLVVLALLMPAVSLLAQAKLEVVGGTTLDWGQVGAPKEGHLTGTIKMKNVGDRALKITEVKPGCGCTKTDPDKTELMPGEVSTMGVTLNIAVTQSGPLTKSITLRWMDKEGEAIRHMQQVQGLVQPTTVDTMEKVEYLYLKADIQRPIMVNPAPYYSFQDLEVGKKSEAKVEIKNNDKAPITFSNWTTEGGIILSKSESVTLQPGESMELVATVIPSVKGNFSGAVYVFTTNPENPKLEIKAWGFAKENTSPVFQQTPK